MRYLLLSILLISCLNINAQEEPVREPRGFYLTISPGIWVPLGKLHTTFDNSPLVSVKFVLQGEKVKMELGGDVVWMNNAEPFNYANKDTSFVTNRNLSIGSFGVSLGRIKQLSPTSYMENFIGIGHSAISTDVKQLKSECAGYNQNGWHSVDDNCEGSSKYNYLEVGSFYLSTGAELQKIFLKKRIFVVRTEYRFSPYSWFGKVEKGFGNSSLTTSFTIRF